MRISQEYRLAHDGPSDYNLITLRGMNGQAKSDMPHMVIANGWSAGPSLYYPWAVRMIEAAKGNLAVTTYQDPLVGSSAYGASYKAERLARSTQMVGWDRPVTIVGHSAGWLTAAEVGGQMIHTGFVHGMAGLTPMGHGEMKDFDLKQAAISLATEVVGSPRAMTAFDSVATCGRLVMHGLTHLTAGPVKGFGEIRDIMCADVSARTAELSDHTPTTMIAGAHDTVIPPDCLERRLEAANYQGSLAVIDTTHVGALIDYNRVPDIYAALQNVLLQP